MADVIVAGLLIAQGVGIILIAGFLFWAEGKGWTA